MDAERHEVESLLVQIREGSEPACRLFFNNYKNMVANLCYRFLGPGADISEMTQKIFIELFKSLESFRGDSELKTWIYRICANQCYKEIRDRRVISGHFVQNESAAASVADDALPNNPEALFASKERSTVVQKALSTLDPDKRLVILLHDLEECTMNEVAYIVNISVGTVKSRLFHARREMRRKLEKLAEAL